MTVKRRCFCVLFLFVKKGVLFMNRSKNSTNSTNYNRNRSRKRGNRSERMLKHEIESLMGIHNPTYKRVKGGAFKQK